MPAKSKKRVFYFHYNKVESRRLKQGKMTIHFKGKCHIVDNIRCSASVRTKHSKRQPFIMMTGLSDDIYFTENELGRTCFIE